MERLKKDMEKSKGGTVVLSTGLKDKRAPGTMIGEASGGMTEVDGEEEEEEEEVEDVVFSDDEDDYEDGENEEEFRFDL